MWSSPASASTRSTQNSQKKRYRYFTQDKLFSLSAKKYFQVLDISEREFFDGMGVYFVRFVGQYGYDRVLSVLGRHMRDFLNGCDPDKC
jgi:hypothetical protein